MRHFCWSFPAQNIFWNILSYRSQDMILISCDLDSSVMHDCDIWFVGKCGRSQWQQLLRWEIIFCDKHAIFWVLCPQWHPIFHWTFNIFVFLSSHKEKWAVSWTHVLCGVTLLSGTAQRVHGCCQLLAKATQTQTDSGHDTPAADSQCLASWSLFLYERCWSFPVSVVGSGVHGNVCYVWARARQQCPRHSNRSALRPCIQGTLVKRSIAGVNFFHASLGPPEKEK